MTATTLACLICAALAWSCLDALRKGLGARLDIVSALLMLTLVQVPAFGVWLYVEGWPLVKSGFWPLTLGVLALNLLSNLMFLRAVQVSPLSRTVPYLSLTPVFTIGAAALALGEWPTTLQLVGMGLVLLGAIGLNAGHLHPRQIDKGVLLMIGVAIIWATNSVFDKMAVSLSSPPLHGMVQIGGLAVIVALWLGLRGRLGEALHAGMRHRGIVLASGGVAALAMGLQLVALQLTLASVVEVVKRAIGLVMAVLLGRMFFGEGFTAGKWVSVGLMGAGTILVLTQGG
ncbi:MAG: EamA family transporter [Bradymonadia bacterium]